MTAQTLRKRANNELADLSRIYHDGLPIQQIDIILETYGFQQLEPAIYCGRDGQTLAQVAEKTFLSMSWHRMESGRYEVITYLS